MIEMLNDWQLYPEMQTTRIFSNIFLKYGHFEREREREREMCELFSSVSLSTNN